MGHSGKSFGGGLDELREELTRRGVGDPLWLIVDDGAELEAKAREAVDAGAETVFSWGGDGTVQCCVNVLAGTGVALAVLPAGTANLLAENLGVPQDLAEAVEIGLHGPRRRMDVGRVNDEAFAVMAGAGLDARIIGDADDAVKARIGRLAYVISAAKNAQTKPFGVKAEVDGAELYDGPATCVLIGNVGELFAGLEAFQGAEPDDGVMEIGVVTAEGALQWLGTAMRAAFGDVADSPHTEVGEFRRGGIITFDRDVPFELDGNERGVVDRMELEVAAGALTVCVPPEGDAEG